MHRQKLRVNGSLKHECIPVGCVPPAHWSYLRISSYPTHTPLGATTHAPRQQPCMPPQSNHACPPGATMHTPWSNHAQPPEQPCMLPQATTHAPPRSSHTHPPGSNHTCPPGATTHAPPVDRIVDTRFWKYYLAPTSLWAVTRLLSSRIHTAHMLPISPSMHCAGGGLLRGVPGPEGSVCSGGSTSGGCLVWGLGADTLPPPPTWTESQKHSLAPTSLRAVITSVYY